ncbi:hypothetical protein VTK73DRAFT_1461 [Phialemonium thermophilum]|uniref:Zn(2)-C6 fungal-type domain-containing protein n=1 Tax=Phialemonium thermophilum TaxID=223376 RepID=A0ABR3XA23_9PEZI
MKDRPSFINNGKDPNATYVPLSSANDRSSHAGRIPINDTVNREVTMIPNTQERRRSKEPQRIRTGPRMMVACIYCKEHKLKCDNSVPACANCCRFNRTCLVEDPITRRHQPRNYLEILENRVVQLEGLLRRTGQRTPQNFELSDSGFDSATQFGVSPASLTPTPPKQPSRVDKGEEDVDSLAAKIGTLGLKAAGIEPHYLGSSSAFAFSRAIGSSLLLRDVGAATSNVAMHSLNDHPPALLPCALPSYEDGLVLSNAYFENIHIQYPFLHEPTFRMWEAQTVSSLNVPSSDPEVALFFVYIVYAVGALLLPNRGQSHKQLYASAQLYLDSVLQRDNLQSVQALVACSIYSLRSPTGPSLWKLTGLALRQCIELGYHRDVRRLGPSVNDFQLELRKRAFWTAFAVDCSVATLLGRPLGLPLQEIDVEFPKNVGDGALLAAAGGASVLGQLPFSSAATDMSVAIHMFRLRCIWAKIHVALFSDTRRIRATDESYSERIRQLRAELEEWYATIPPEPPRTGEALSLFGSKDWYDANYSHSILLLHRNHLIETRAAVPDHIVLECLDAAESISRGYYRQFVTGSVGYTWSALHFLFLAGLTYLHCLWTSPTARSSRLLDNVSSTCMDCSMVLAVMAERWGGAAPYRDIFENLSRRTISMMMADNDPAVSEWPDSFGVSTLANSGGLEDPWEVMQWIGGDVLLQQPTSVSGTFAI